MTGSADDEAIELLHDYLMSDRAPVDSMLISDLDGFLTALAIGPELVAPSEWLPHVWGGPEPGFADEKEAKRITGAILGRYNRILESIADGSFAPVLWETEAGDLLAGDWAIGFSTGVGLRSDSWEPLLESENWDLLTPIIILAGDEDILAGSNITPENETEALAEAADALPEAVLGIAAFWRRRNRPPPVRSTKIGRNAPCSCGSGRKFKQCCGAAA